MRSLVKIGRQLVNICELSYRRDLIECCLAIDDLVLKYNDALRRRLVSDSHRHCKSDETKCLFNRTAY